MMKLMNNKGKMSEAGAAALAVFILCLLFFFAYHKGMTGRLETVEKESYEQGFSEGYNEGYSDGYCDCYLGREYALEK